MKDKAIQCESFQFSASEQMAINEALTDKTDIVWRLRANWSYLGREAAEEITRLRNKVEQLQREVADAKRWAMQERTLRWHNLAAEGFAEAANE